MTETVTAVYENGVYRPIQPQPVPPAEGAVVRLRINLDDDSVLVRGPTDPAAVRERGRRIAALPMEPGGDPTITARDHDRALYGRPEGPL